MINCKLSLADFFNSAWAKARKKEISGKLKKQLTRTFLQPLGRVLKKYVYVDTAHTTRASREKPLRPFGSNFRLKSSNFIETMSSFDTCLVFNCSYTTCLVRWPSPGFCCHFKSLCRELGSLHRQNILLLTSTNDTLGMKSSSPQFQPEVWSEIMALVRFSMFSLWVSNKQHDVRINSVSVTNWDRNFSIESLAFRQLGQYWHPLDLHKYIHIVWYPSRNSHMSQLSDTWTWCQNAFPVEACRNRKSYDPFSSFYSTFLPFQVWFILAILGSF